MTLQDATPSGAPGNLPLLAIARQSAELLLRHPAAFLAAMAAPLLIELATVWAFWSTYGPEMVRLGMSGAGSLDQPGIFMLRMFGLMLVLLIAYVLFAVAWHRYALLGPRETPTAVPSVQGRHVRFLLTTYGVSLLLGLMAFAALFALGALRVSSQIVPILLGFALALVFVRWQLVFPAIAVDAPLGLSGSWNASRGQTLRLFWLFLIVVLPPVAIRWFIDSLFAEPVGQFILTGTLTVPAALGLAISAIVGYVMLALLVAAVSGAYRSLVIERQRRPTYAT